MVAIVVRGNPIDGVNLFGPFADNDTASEWSEGLDGDYWITNIESGYDSRDDIDNDDRSNDAEICLKVFQLLSRDEDESLVRDLLSSIMHYCEKHAIDFDHERSVATDFFSEERGN